MVDTFVKPPVSIEIVFRQPINIEKIIIDAKVNTKISNYFVIYTSIDSKEEKSNFHQIAKCFNEKNPSTNYIYEFLNRRAANNSNDILNTNASRTFFSTRSLLYLESVTALKITILKTLNSTMPCMKSLKIIGILTKNILKGANEKTTANQHSSTQAKSEKIALIPNEFIDEITHEMIRNPIRLPSGKVVDKKTFDSFLEEQRKNIEFCKDPFTCVPFSQKYTPIIDEQLKSKIDKFLFDNRDSVLKFQNEINDTIEKSSIKRAHNNTEVNMPNKSRRLDTSSSEKKSEKCDCCLNIKSDKNELYELISCKHIYCKHCLKSMNKKCILCKKTFENDQVVHLDRRHF